MSDICEQLRKASTHALMSASRQTVLDAAAEIERLRLTARDTFAAAALTGLIVAMRDEEWSEICAAAYGWADAMLRERGASAEKYSDVRISRIAKTTDHDAAPAARARTDADSDRTDKAVSRPGEGTGDTPVTEPMPILLSGSGFVTPVSYAKSDEKRVNWPTNRGTTPPRNGTPAVGSVRGEGTEEPVAWAVAGDNGDYGVALCVDKASAQTEADRLALVGLRPDYVVVPLYRHPQPTLTDAEREAVEWVIARTIDFSSSRDEDKKAATLRGLLKRLGGER